LNEFGSLDTILEEVEEIDSTRVRNTIKEHVESIERGRSLVSLRDEIDLPVEFDDLEMGNPDIAKLHDAFNRLEIASFSDGLSPDTSDPDDEWEVIKTEGALEELIDGLKEEDEFALDLETDGLNPIDANPLGISISPRPAYGVYIPVGDDEFPDLTREVVRKKLKPLLEDGEIGKMGQNLKFDSLVLKGVGIDLRGITFDSMIASYLLKPTKRRHNLKEIVGTFLGKEVKEYKDLFDEGEIEDFARLPLEEAAPYAVGDSTIIWELKPLLTEKLEKRDQVDLFAEIEVPLIRVLRDMEFNGIKLERDRLEGGKRKLEDRLASLQERINELAEEELNPNSPKQVREILFDKLDLPVIEKTKTGPSTNAHVLNKLSEEHPLPEKISEYRELSKLLNTYVDALPEKINERTGRIHTSFNQTATATGRLSSSDPNLQNIPKGSQLGGELRRAFVPSDGHKLVGADYSQIELRILAHLSGDEELITTFREGDDLHTKTAAKIFGVHPDWVDGKMRDRAKRVNFGIVYGITEYGLSRDLGVSREKAKAYIDQFFNLYPGARRYLDELIARAERDHYAETIFHRRRYLPNINSNNWNKRNYDRRNAINTPIQGSAADLMKVAMLDVNEALEEGDITGKLLLQIHDELILETPEAEVPETTAKVKEIMEDSLEFRVPIKVDVSSGEDWSQL
ncbi:DNA polymerase I, partial [Candidatus Bipolaricaulota bacterium]|nr:DNA polymerase I [Candidatus Bipolaricaulota bacterium]